MNQKKTQKDKKKKTVKSNKQIILLASIIVLILLVILICLLITYSRAKENEGVTENRKSFENAIQEVKNEQYEEGEIVPNRFNMIVRMYEGDADINQTFRDIYTLVEISIPDMQKRFKGKDNSEIEKYFNENKSRIEANIGINKKEDYVALVNSVKNKELGEYVDSTFDEINYTNKGDKDQVPLEIVYTKETLNLIVEIDHEVSNSNPIRFLVKQYE